MNILFLWMVSYLPVLCFFTFVQSQRDISFEDWVTLCSLGLFRKRSKGAVLWPFMCIVYTPRLLTKHIYAGWLLCFYLFIKICNVFTTTSVFTVSTSNEGYSLFSPSNTWDRRLQPDMRELTYLHHRMAVLHKSLIND